MKNYIIMDGISPEIRTRFYENLSDYPCCTDSLKAGNWKCPKHIAIKRRYIEFNRENYFCAYLPFDFDYAGAILEWLDQGLPVPTFIATNPKNGHSHLTLELTIPVHLGGNASPKAIYYLSVIRRGYINVAGADPTFGGHLSKNPLSDHWTVSSCDVTYDLDELAEPLRDISVNDILNTPFAEVEERIKQAQIPLNRKPKHPLQRDDPHGSLFIFDNTRYHSYEIVRHCASYRELYEKIEKYIRQLHARFALQLTDGRIRSDARSIAKWTWHNRHYLISISKVFSERQRELAYKSHKSRRKNNQAKIRAAFKQATKEGIKPTQKNITELSGLGIATIKRHWKKFKK